MGFLDFISGVGEFLVEAVSTVGEALVSAAETFVEKLSPVIEVAIRVVETVANVIAKVAESLGIAPPEENMAELGAKAMQEGTRPRAEGESSQEFLDYLRTEVPLDEEKFNNMSEKEKLACNVLGTHMVAESIEEKTGVEIPSEFLLAISKVNLTAVQVRKLIDAFAEQGIDSMGELTEYFSNELPENRAEEIDGVVEGSLKELAPDMSEDEIRQEIIDMKVEYQKPEEA